MGWGTNKRETENEGIPGKNKWTWGGEFVQLKYIDLFIRIKNMGKHHLIL